MEKFEKPTGKEKEWAEKAAFLKERLWKISKREGITFPERMTIQDKIAGFGKKLLDKYGMNEVRKCVLYHILGGSDNYEEIVEYFDFPGEYSVEEFIERLEEEEGKKKDKK